ncbi:hypothetical protein Agub_g401, partial [Astrephomene gubernaculifera]
RTTIIHLGLVRRRSHSNLGKHKMLLSSIRTFHTAMEAHRIARQLGTTAQQRWHAPARPSPAAVALPARRQLSARSSKGGRPDPETDKSWGEIIGDAAGVAKSVLNKIKDTAASILPVPKGPTEKPTPTPKPEVPFGPPGGGLLPNLIGRAVGGLLSSALSSLSAQLEEAAREQAGAYQEAVARIQGSAKLRARLGSVTVGPVMSQSSSSSSINGVVTKQVALMLPVYGSLGASGTAQVTVVEGAQQPGGRSMQIMVRTLDGGIITVDDGPGAGGSGGRSNVIDVEFREVKK